jgi:hypothetical protein
LTGLLGSRWVKHLLAGMSWERVAAALPLTGPIQKPVQVAPLYRFDTCSNPIHFCIVGSIHRWVQAGQTAITQAALSPPQGAHPCLARDNLCDDWRAFVGRRRQPCVVKPRVGQGVFGIALGAIG